MEKLVSQSKCINENVYQKIGTFFAKQKMKKKITGSRFPECRMSAGQPKIAATPN